MTCVRLLQILVLFGCLATGGCGATRESSARGVELRVAELAEAFRVADAQRLEALIAPAYVHTNGGSAPLTRQQWFSYIVARREELGSGALRLARYENQDLEITVQRDVAIVTGVNISEGERDGTPFVRNLRFTQLWQFGPAGWQRVAFHDAEVAP